MQGKTLIIHIGAHKTGSTTIQEAFAAGGVALDGADVFYPARLDHNYLRADFISHETGQPLPKRGRHLLSFEGLAAAIKASSAPYILLSAEYFEKLDPRLMQAVVEQYFRPHIAKLKVIAYLRPHVPRLLSGYAEAIKIGWFRDDIDAFFDNHRSEFLFSERFAAWREVFGSEFEMRAMHEERLKGGDVLGDFVDVAFDGRRALRLPERNRNTSLYLEDLAFLRLMQERFQEKRDWLRHAFGWELARQLQQMAPEPQRKERLELHESLAARVAEACAGDAAEIDALFFAQAPLFSDALREGCRSTRSKAQSLLPEDHFEPEELRNLLAMRELIWDAMRMRHDWASFFHGFRMQGLADAP